jgi:hypothetical protein
MSSSEAEALKAAYHCISWLTFAAMALPLSFLFPFLSRQKTLCLNLLRRLRELNDPSLPPYLKEQPNE